MGFSMHATFDPKEILDDTEDVHILVGYPSDEMHECGESMADLAEILEAGDAYMPARPHLQEGIEFALPEINMFMSRRRSAKGQFMKHDYAMYEHIGALLVEGVKEYVYSGFLAPNAPYTLARKEGDQPLVDTHSLINSLTYSVVEGGE